MSYSNTKRYYRMTASKLHLEVERETTYTPNPQQKKNLDTWFTSRDTSKVTVLITQIERYIHLSMTKQLEYDTNVPNLIELS